MITCHHVMKIIWQSWQLEWHLCVSIYKSILVVNTTWKCVVILLHIGLPRLVDSLSWRTSIHINLPVIYWAVGRWSLWIRICNHLLLSETSTQSTVEPGMKITQFSWLRGRLAVYYIHCKINDIRHNQTKDFVNFKRIFFPKTYYSFIILLREAISCI